MSQTAIAVQSVSMSPRSSDCILRISPALPLYCLRQVNSPIYMIFFPPSLLFLSCILDFCHGQRDGASLGLLWPITKNSSWQLSQKQIWRQQNEWLSQYEYFFGAFKYKKLLRNYSGHSQKSESIRICNLVARIATRSQWTLSDPQTLCLRYLLP